MLINKSIKWPGLNGMDLAQEVTTNKTYIWKGYKTWKKNKGYEKNIKKKFRVVAIDYGIKKNILRYFSDFDCEVKVVSCKEKADNIIKLNPHGIFLSNGPGVFHPNTVLCISLLALAVDCPLCMSSINPCVDRACANKGL